MSQVSPGWLFNVEAKNFSARVWHLPVDLHLIFFTKWLNPCLMLQPQGGRKLLIFLFFIILPAAVYAIFIYTTPGETSDSCDTKCSYRKLLAATAGYSNLLFSWLNSVIATGMLEGLPGRMAVWAVSPLEIAHKFCPFQMLQSSPCQVIRI